MTFYEYQDKAARTQNGKLNRNQRLNHALFGMCSEVGEIHGLYQKMFQGHPLNFSEVLDEVGDLMWFISELCDVLGVTMDDVAARNIEKLEERYPDGFDAEKSVHREEKA